MANFNEMLMLKCEFGLIRSNLKIPITGRGGRVELDPFCGEGGGGNRSRNIMEPVEPVQNVIKLRNL